MSEKNYSVIEAESPIKAWTRGVEIEATALKQLKNVASLPFIYKWVAAMPDAHWGMGATVGSVIATKGAVIPAAVGVDLGCGMVAVETNLCANDLPDNLAAIRAAIEKSVPHGRTDNGGRNDRGAWHEIPEASLETWSRLKQGYDQIIEKHSRLDRGSHVSHLGTLGTGNHFIEVCLDERDAVWVMLHSGSRGVGNRIGSYFIEKAKQEMKRWHVNLPDVDLAYLPDGSEHFDDYCFAVEWAQNFAFQNRELMVRATLAALEQHITHKPVVGSLEGKVVNCHHNYIAREEHFGQNVWVTRKGAVRAREGDMGIIPGSMGAKSYITRGKGNPESFHSSSHGAGRVMSRGEARRRITLDDHLKATAGVECRKDADVIDESPAAYKSIDAVMEAQKDLVEVVHTLKQVICVKG